MNRTLLLLNALALAVLAGLILRPEVTGASSQTGPAMQAHLAVFESIGEKRPASTPSIARRASTSESERIVF